MEENSSNLIDLQLTDEESRIINDNMPIKTYPKGTVLLREGQIALDSYHVIKGCIRSYYLKDGEERTTAFYTEDQSCASLDSYTNQVPAKHYLECVEDTTVAVLNFHKEKELIQRIPKFETLCRMAMENDFGKNQERLANFMTQTPEERYLHLLDSRPELLQRVPHYQLASYLGIKPESLSRIRKRIAGKK